MSSQKNILILTAIIAFATTEAIALDYTSYFFSTEDIIFFAYEDDTHVALYTASGEAVAVEPNILNKGQHAYVDRPASARVYFATGSKKFSVLTGDPATNGISGYYAMDANGLGTCKEFYTYVPLSYPQIYFDHQLFIVFAYQDNTQVTVQRDIGNGDYQDINTFTLDKGKHWANSEISNKYLHIIADKPVSALTCHDQSYFVPSAGGRWSGTEFYTYLSGIKDWPNGWPADLTVIAYHDGTSVSIRDSNDSNTTDPIWEGTLDSGKAHVESYPDGVYKYFTVTSSKPVTVSAQPWVASTVSCWQEVFIPDRIGTGVGTDLIGSTLDGDLAYLYILAHMDNTHVELYDSNNGYRQASYTLNMGQAVNANPGNGLWKIVSDKDISAYSGGRGNSGGEEVWAAEFAPLAFNTFHLFSLEKVDVNEPNSVLPDGHITYEITYGPNGVDHNNVVITDYLPYEVDYENFDPNYNPDKHTYTWQIGSLAANDPNINFS